MENNLYRERRKALNWSLEEAAEQLFISDDKLQRIETGKQSPSAEDIMHMSEVYKAPELCNYYCHNQCDIGKENVPEIPVTELPNVTLQLLDSLNSASDIEKMLIKITADNQISDDELESLVDIEQKLEHLSIAISALKLCIKRKSKNDDLNRALYSEIYSKKQSIR